MNYGALYHLVKRMNLSASNLARIFRDYLARGMLTTASFYLLALVRKIGPNAAQRMVGANVRSILQLARLALSQSI